jgi:hypothetical protein
MASAKDILLADRERQAECVCRAAERAKTRLQNEDIQNHRNAERRHSCLQIKEADLSTLKTPGWWKTWKTWTPQGTKNDASKGKQIEKYSSEREALADQLRYWKAREIPWSEKFAKKVKEQDAFALHTSTKKSDPGLHLVLVSMRRGLRPMHDEYGKHHA